MALGHDFMSHASGDACRTNGAGGLLGNRVVQTAATAVKEQPLSCDPLPLSLSI